MFDSKKFQSTLLSKFGPLSNEDIAFIIKEFNDLDHEEIFGLSKEQSHWLREMYGVYGEPVERRELYRKLIQENIEYSQTYQLSNFESKKRDYILTRFFQSETFGIGKHIMNIEKENNEKRRNKVIKYLGIEENVSNYIMSHTSNELIEVFGKRSVFEPLLNYEELVFPKDYLINDEVTIDHLEEYFEPRTFHVFEKRLGLDYTLGKLLLLNKKRLYALRGFGDKAYHELEQFKDLLVEKFPDMEEHIKKDSVKNKVYTKSLNK